MTLPSFPAFDFVPHSGTFSKDILPLLNGGHTSVGALYDAPELLPLLNRWATYCDNQRYGLRALAEEAPAFYRSPDAPAHFARRISEAPADAWVIGKSLLASDDHRALVSPSMFATERNRLAYHPPVCVFVAQAHLYPEEFATRALGWLEESKECIRKFRRDSRHMNGPDEGWVHGLFASLALAPSLTPEIVKHLEKRKIEPGALIALLRHGHAKTRERVRDPQTFIAIHNSRDYTYGAAALLVAMGDDGRKMLRDILLDTTSPAHRVGLISAAVDLGIWDRELTDAYFAAAELNAPGAVDAANELPLLDRDDVRRLENVPGVSAEALSRQRDTTRKPEAPWNKELWQLSAEALVERLGSLTSKDMLQLTGLVAGARRAADRFALACAELRSSKNPVTQLVLRLAARPAQRYPGALTKSGHLAGLALQDLEWRWRPERFARAIADAPAKLKRSPSTKSKPSDPAFA